MTVPPIPPAKRKYVKMTPALHAEMVRQKARGKSCEAIAQQTGVSTQNVRRVLSRPVTQAEIADLSRRLGVDKESVRARQKEILLTRAAAMTERAFDLAETTITNENAREFAHAMHGLERLDKISGNTVGEGQRVIHEGLPSQLTPQQELAALIAVVLGRPVDAQAVAEAKHDGLSRNSGSGLSG